MNRVLLPLSMVSTGGSSSDCEWLLLFAGWPDETIVEMDSLTGDGSAMTTAPFQSVSPVCNLSGREGGIKFLDEIELQHNEHNFHDNSPASYLRADALGIDDGHSGAGNER
jgi:hypothetical protein